MEGLAESEDVLEENKLLLCESSLEKLRAIQPWLVAKLSQKQTVSGLQKSSVLLAVELVAFCRKMGGQWGRIVKQNIMQQR